MAICKMRRLNLAAMAYDRDDLLNTLQSTGAVEIKTHSEAKNTVVPPFMGEELKSYLARAESALNALSSAVDAYDKDNKIKSDVLKDGFDVTYSDFMASGNKKDEADKLICRIEEILTECKQLQGELSKAEKALKEAADYAVLDVPFGFFKDTRHTVVRLGCVPTPFKEELLKAADGEAQFDCQIYGESVETTVVAAVYHKEYAAEAEAVLSGASFTPCPFTGELTGKQQYEAAEEQTGTIREAVKANEAELYALNTEVKNLKIYCDYLAFALEKEEASEKLRATERTFLLEAYVPQEAEEAVKNSLDNSGKTVYYEFCDPADDEAPPTLLKNNKVVCNFETITNMYSPPSYREFDPNTIMAFFYSLFLGFIMADIGYGLLMILGGGIIAYKKRERESGFKRLAMVFCIGGIFSVIWGVLFNSFFGIQLFPFTALPNAQEDMWTFVGISVPAVLVISLLIGILQLCAGYICLAVQNWRRGGFWDGVFDGLIWAVFSVGVALAVVGFTDDFSIPILKYVGGITAGASLVIAMLTAGRKEKFFGKFIKGFGAAYGIINFASDILSYARLYGLMLSGAVIAQIISTYGVQFVTSGNAGLILLGVAIMIIGHAFNLAMSLLGAYIHDARLQYVEFYGKFFEGEGELFTPLGSQHKYIYVTK